MATISDPEKVEVIAWMARQANPSALEAARHFFPGISPDEQRKKAATLRVWWQRAGGAERMRPPEPPPATGKPVAQGQQRYTVPPVQVHEPDPPCYDMADTPEMAQLRELLATAWTDYYTSRGLRDLRLASTLRREITDLACRLESLRQKAARVVKLDRTASAVAAELAKRQKALDMRAEMQRRAEERKAKVAESKQVRERKI